MPEVKPLFDETGRICQRQPESVPEMQTVIDRLEKGEIDEMPLISFLRINETLGITADDIENILGQNNPKVIWS